MVKRALHRIQELGPNLTVSERTVAHWLENHVDELAFKPAAFIAQQCGVSESTVVRFARKLGYDSYPDLQHQEQEAVQDQLSLRRKLQQSVAATGSDQVLSGVIKRDIQNLQQSLQTIDAAQFQQAMQRLAAARRVGILGFRSSATAASYLNFTLHLVRPDVSLIGRNGDMMDHLLDFGPNDVMVAISVARAVGRTVQAARYCQAQGIPVIGMTDWLYAPLSRYADPCLKVATAGVFWESQTAMVSLCNALVTGVAHTLADSAERRARRLDEAAAAETRGDGLR